MELCPPFISMMVPMDILLAMTPKVLSMNSMHMFISEISLSCLFLAASTSGTVEEVQQDKMR